MNYGTAAALQKANFACCYCDFKATSNAGLGAHKHFKHGVIGKQRIKAASPVKIKTVKSGSDLQEAIMALKVKHSAMAEIIRELESML